MADIFISYANQDRERAQSISAWMSTMGWSVFWDRTIPAGKSWREFIGEELEQARCIIVLWSSNSVNSRWVLEEADEGLHRAILLPVFIEEVVPPLGFRALQGAMLTGPISGADDPMLGSLVADTALMLGEPMPQPETAPAQAPAPEPETVSAPETELAPIPGPVPRIAPEPGSEPERDAGPESRTEGEPASGLEPRPSPDAVAAPYRGDAAQPGPTGSPVDASSKADILAPAAVFAGIGLAASIIPLALLETTGGRPEIEFEDALLISICTLLTAAVLAPGLAILRGALAEGPAAGPLFRRVSMAALVGCASWWVVGYSLAFDYSSKGLVGDFSYMFWYGIFFESDGTMTLNGSIPELSFVLFIMVQLMACGGMLVPSRGKVAAYGFVALWMALVLAPLTHWIWGGGWLGSQGVLDFAGGFTFVALGIALAILTRMLDAEARTAAPCEQTRTLNLVIPVAVLVGCVGLNSGSELASNAIALRAGLGTGACAVASLLAWGLLSLARRDSTQLGAAGGLLPGAVASLPCAGNVSVAGWIVIGAVAGLLCRVLWGLRQTTPPMLLGAMFALSGATGLIVLPAFTGSVESSFLTQLLAVGAVGLYSAAVTALLALVFRRALGAGAPELDAPTAPR